MLIYLLSSGMETLIGGGGGGGGGDIFAIIKGSLRPALILKLCLI